MPEIISHLATRGQASVEGSRWLHEALALAQPMDRDNKDPRDESGRTVIVVFAPLGSDRHTPEVVFKEPADCIDRSRPMQLVIDIGRVDDISIRRGMSIIPLDYH